MTDRNLDTGALVLGWCMGLILGGFSALFLVPRSGAEARQQLSAQIEEALVPADPVEKSLAEGRAAARRRRESLGLNP
jgi:gas vesicle protein